ncbi:MAG TPA: hypothetical protein VLB83_05795 [Candidatus Paceibacterota bacterium]|nr:hypothetical protein [Candidatus Paceibacterota bacterium]
MDHLLIPLLNRATKIGLPYAAGVQIEYEVPDDYPALVHALEFLADDLASRDREAAALAPTVHVAGDLLKANDALACVESGEFSFPVHLGFFEEDRAVFEEYVAVLRADAAGDDMLDDALETYEMLGDAFYKDRKAN